MTGMTVTGWPVGTVVRGVRVMWEGALVAPASGGAPSNSSKRSATRVAIGRQFSFAEPHRCRSTISSGSAAQSCARPTGRVEPDDGPALDAILRRVRKLDRTTTFPITAATAATARTIYIDRHMPKSFAYKGRKIDTDAFLILHRRSRRR